MKRIKFIITLTFLMIVAVGCSDTNSSNETQNPIAEKIYNSSREIFDFQFIKFYDDNTFQGIKVEPATTGNKKTNHYGTYSIDGNAITINILDKSYYGVVLDDGASIFFDDDKLTDHTNDIKANDPILNEFK